MKFFFVAVLSMFFSVCTIAQETKPQKLKVFIDCANADCDYNFMRTEINLVDFFLDRVAADVHVLITQRQAGNGGAQFQMIFYGQRRYASSRDTLTMQAGQNATGFEQRDLMIHYLKMGLAPFIAKTEQASGAVISMKMKEDSTKKNTVTKDKWNYWVHNLGAEGWADYNKNYLSGRYGGYYSTNRTTDKLRVNFNINSYTNFNRFTIPFDDGTPDSTRILVKNSKFTFNHLLVKSINDHWSYGYDVKLSGNSFTNYKNRLSIRPAIEYNFFKYSEVNTRFLVLNYGVEVRQNQYIEPTIYQKNKEIVYLHSLKLNASVTQKWGSIGAGIVYRNYLHDFRLTNLSINGFTEIRITGGLTFFYFMNGSLVHDQIYLPFKEADGIGVITQQRQLASSFLVYSEAGINFRFGSKLNNFVNQRFTGRSNNLSED